MKHTLASKILCVLITLCMLVGMVPVFGLAASALDATVDADGTTILISTPQQLAAIGKDANYPRDGAYKLVNDIDLSKFDTDSNPENGNWAPLCAKYASAESPYYYDKTTAFIGTFDGQGYTISGMRMIFSKEIDGIPYNDIAVGLFAGVGSDTVTGTVKNLIVKDAYIFARPWTKVYAGVVVGRTNDKGAIIDNVAVINSSIDVTANNTGNDSGVGGIVGNATGSTISNVYVDAALKIGTEKINHEKFGVAGIVGSAWKGRVKINGAVFNGTIDTSNFAESNYVYKQGVFAYNWNYPTVDSYQAFSNSYYNSDKLAVYDTAVVDAESGVVTTVGTNGGHYNGTGLTTEDLSTKKLSELGLSGTYWCAETGELVLDIMLPKTVPNFPDYIPLYDAWDMAKIGKDAAYPLDGKYYVMNDIDMSDYGAWTPLGNLNNTSLNLGWIGNSAKGEDYVVAAEKVFKGTFDGGGHTISNMTVSYSTTRSFAGLFGIIHTATVKNIVFKSASVTTTGTQTSDAGIVAGATTNNNTIIQNVSVYDSTVTANNSQAKNHTTVGGLVGYGAEGATVKNCYVDADLVANFTVENSYSEQMYVSGFVGASYNCLAKVYDSVFVGTLTNNYHNYSDGTEKNLSYNFTAGINMSTNTNLKGASSNVYYIDTAGVNTAETSKKAQNGTAISADALKTATAASMGFDGYYWKNDGEGLYLAVASIAVNANGAIEIDTADELSYIGKYDTYPKTGDYVLTKDIDLSSLGNWTPLCGGLSASKETGFRGTFDGQGYVISGMNITGSAENVTAGLFGAATDNNANNGTVIKNIVFDNCAVDVSGTKSVDAAIVVGVTDVDNNNWVDVQNIAILNSSVNGTAAQVNYSGIGSVAGNGTGLQMENIYSDAELSGGCAAANDNFGMGGLVGRSWRGYAWAKYSIFNGTITNTTPDTGNYFYVNGILGCNWNQSSYPTTASGNVNVYYNSEKLTPSTKTNGGAVDGVALDNFDLGISPASVLGFSSEYWMHNGDVPMLKIAGFAEYDTADINEDTVVNVKDLVRLKKYLADNSEEICLIAADLKRDQEITSDDLTYMRRTLLGVSIATTIKLAEGSDSVKYLGRANVENNILLMDWSNTGFEFSGIMEGDVTATLTHVSASAATAEDPYTYARVLVSVDGVEKIINVNNGTAVYTLAEALDFGAHTIKVLKITERTKGRIYGIDVNFVGSVADRPADKDLVIDFYGDSITAGDGVVKNDRKGSVDYLEGQYSNLTYAAKTAKALNADMRVAARSGLKTKDAVSYLINAGSWDYENNQADIVVINLGTNDKWVIWDDNNPDTEEKAAHEYGIAVEKAAIEAMLDAVVANYPDAKIVWVYGMMGNGLAEHIQPVVEAYAANNANVFYCELPANTSGGGNHPNEAGHAAAADVLADFINANVLAK